MRHLLIWFSITFVLASACVTHDILSDQVDCTASSLKLDLIEIATATSCEAEDGIIEVFAEGGLPPFQYSIGNSVQANGRFASLRSGVYTVSVADALGCQTIIPNITVGAAGFSFQADVTSDTDCISGNGSISITVLEGQSPFLFQFEGQALTELSEFHGLKKGEYSISLKDANECSAMLRVSVPKGNTGTSWKDDIQPLIQTNCAFSGCHNGLSRPDLRLYEKAKFYAAQMKTLTADKSMPFDGSLSQSQIDLIACWVDEGARDN